MIETGDTAPTFELPGTDGGEVETFRLSHYLDEGLVVLAFYVFDFHPSCRQELCSIRDLNWFDIHPALDVFAIGTDRAFSHQAFAEEFALDFALLSDSGGEVSESYGVLYDEFNNHKRVSKRAVFLIDTERTVRYRWVTDDPSVLPDWSTVERAVRSILPLGEP